MIEAKGLTKKFIRREQKGKKEEFAAVDNVSFKALDGEILGVLGPNGAGKTTLLRMLGGLMKPDDGEVVITDKDGEIVTYKEKKKAMIGYLSENTKLYNRFSIRELLRICADIYGFSEEYRDERMQKIENLLEMSSFMDNRIEKLSTGQKQRANIARCLLHDPLVYIFDEPTLGLDIISSKSIVDFMKQEKAKNKCVIYSTHYMEEAEYLCDRIIMIYNGCIIAGGTPEELKSKTSTSNLRDSFFNIIE